MSAPAPLPSRLNPRKLATVNGSVAGEIELSGMSRLADFLGVSLANLSGRASLVADFAEDAQRRPTAQGNVAAELPANCRSCQKDFMLAVQAETRVAFVYDEAAAEDLPRDVEPVIVDNEALDVAQWVEDELILAIPVAPRCSRTECEGEAAEKVASEPTRAAFAGLRGLLDDAAGKDGGQG